MKNKNSNFGAYLISFFSGALAMMILSVGYMDKVADDLEQRVINTAIYISKQICE